jgi:hypothetical protein
MLSVRVSIILKTIVLLATAESSESTLAEHAMQILLELAWKFEGKV